MIDCRILITNDDGIDSPGLKAAVESVLDLGTVAVIAPTSQQTATGRGLTGNKESALIPVDYRVKGVKIQAYHCDCSPALIVRHSLKTVFMPGFPHLLIAGINYGENLGANITSSGTVGAALEGASVGIPSIAVSKQTDVASHREYTEQDWSGSKYFLNHFSQLLLNTNPHHDVDVLKIDVPFGANQDTKWKITKVARTGYYFRELENPGMQTRLNEGKTSIKFDETEIGSDSDIFALAIEKVVSVTPLSIDLSSRVSSLELQQHYNNTA